MAGRLPVTEWAQQVFQRFKATEASFAKYLAKTEEQRAELYDRGRPRQDWEVGEQVWRHPTLRPGSKFTARNVGPFRIRVMFGQRCTLERESGEVTDVPLAESVRVPSRVFAEAADLERLCLVTRQRRFQALKGSSARSCLERLCFTSMYLCEDSNALDYISGGGEGREGVQGEWWG